MQIQTGWNAPRAGCELELQRYELGNFQVKRIDLQLLLDAFGERVAEQVTLGRYTAARVGGAADFLLEVHSASELAHACDILWAAEFPFIILGGGSNVLVSDAGVRGLVLLNKAKQARFDVQFNPPTVWAESGVNFGALARQAASRGLAGLEWAAGIPGTLGGAVVGNAGAHGGDMAGNLLVADILHRDRGRELWQVERLAYQYRDSVLKASAGIDCVMDGSPETVVLAALLRLEHSQPVTVQSKIEAFVAYRRKTQPPGASMGSMFKNPPGDYAGRLIEAAGLKGSRVGDAQISPLHANFFVNLGNARAADIYRLILEARRSVMDKFGVRLELEVELIGEWPTAEAI